MRGKSPAASFDLTGMTVGTGLKVGGIRGRRITDWHTQSGGDNAQRAGGAAGG